MFIPSPPPLPGRSGSGSGEGGSPEGRKFDATGEAFGVFYCKITTPSPGQGELNHPLLSRRYKLI